MRKLLFKVKEDVGVPGSVNSQLALPILLRITKEAQVPSRLTSPVAVVAELAELRKLTRGYSHVVSGLDATDWP